MGADSSTKPGSSYSVAAEFTGPSIDLITGTSLSFFSFCSSVKWVVWGMLYCMQEPRWCICPIALYARHFLEYLRLRRRDAAKISDRPSLHLLQLSSMILFLIQVLAGVFVRPNLRNNGVEPSPFYSIPAALWSICCISSVYTPPDISRLNLTIEMGKNWRKEACTSVKHAEGVRHLSYEVASPLPVWT